MLIHSGPNVALNLFTIHKVITRGFDLSLEHIEIFISNGFPDDTIRQGFANYIKALTSICRAHHMVEDRLVFPYFKEKMPSAPMDTLTEQHNQMVPLLEEMKSATERIHLVQENQGALNVLKKALSPMNDMWFSHLQLEESHFELKKVGQLIPPEEHLRLIREFSEYSQTHSGPGYLSVPFILYNLSPGLREAFAKGLPDEVVNHLVPVEWADRWASMKPFLLD